MGVAVGSVAGERAGVGGGVDAFISYSHAADGLLAPRLQSALQRFAKPWWRRRAIRVFRDETSLSANPHLWSSITAALDSAEWFVLLLSVDAAESPWVDREVAYWLEHKDPERILPVLTEGRFVWDEASGSVGSGSSVPPSLLTAFSEEPRWVDLRWARDEMQLDLRDSRFRGVVADVASAVRGVPKDDLESEEVRQHRRTVRTAWTAGIALALLAVTAGAAAIYANSQRREADAQRTVAEEQTGIAVANEARAEEQTLLAESAGQLARSRELAASAINVLDDDPELSLLLGLEAVDAAPLGSEIPLESLSALRQAVQTSRLRARHPVADSPQTLTLDLSPDGTALVVASVDAATVRLYDVDTFTVLWEYSEPDTLDSIGNVYFSPSGAHIALDFIGSDSLQALPRAEPGSDDGIQARVVLLDAATGEVVASRQLGECPSPWLSPFSPDGIWLPVSVGDGAACDDDVNPGGETGWRVELLNPATLATVETIPVSYTAEVTWSADSGRMAATTFEGTGAKVVDTATWETLTEVPEVFTGVLSPDGNLLATFDYFGGYSINLHDVTTGAQVEHLAGLPDFASAFVFTTDGRLLAGSAGDVMAMWELGTGEMVQSIPGVGAGPFAFDEARELIYHAGETDVSVWDLSGATQGEMNTVDTGLWFQGDAMGGGEVRGAAMVFDLDAGQLPLIWPFDALTGELGAEGFPTFMGTAPVTLPDGRVVLAGRRAGATEDEYGPAVAWDPDSGATEELGGCWVAASAAVQGRATGARVECSGGDGEWYDTDRVFLDTAGTRLLVTSVDGGLRFHDPASLELTEVSQLPDGLAAVLVYEGDWFVASEAPSELSGGPTSLSVVQAESGEVVKTVTGVNAARTRDGSLVAVTVAEGAVDIYETSAWEVVASFSINDARIRGFEFSPDGSKLMTGATDAFVRIWATDSGRELSRIPLEGASDAHWLDETHLLVGTSDGLWTTLTLDTDELVVLARSRVTRGFTPDECDAYLIESCG